MDFITKIINFIGTPQITWAMIFAILGYFSKTLIDYYVQKRKTTHELHSKSMFEREREQENVRVSILTQVLLIRRATQSIFHQFLGHAEDRAYAIQRRKQGKPVNEWVDDHMRTYAIQTTILGLGRILAQLNNFQTYQYTRVQAQLRDINLTEKITQLEEVLSRLGIYKGYQNELVLFALQEQKQDLSDIMNSKKSRELADLIKSKKQREKAPLFLTITVSWAEGYIDDFINAWLTLIDQKADKKQPTLADAGIDLSEYIESRYIWKGRIKPDISLLQLRSESTEFLRVFINLDKELQNVFKELDKAIVNR